MREPNLKDISLLIFLAAIWGSSFFNIKIAIDTYEPITLAMVRVFFGSNSIIIVMLYKKSKFKMLF